MTFKVLPRSNWSFGYYGAKHAHAGIYPVPMCRTIVEPFAGSAGYGTHHLVYTRRVDRLVLCDTKPAVLDAWRWLIQATRNDVLAFPAVAIKGDKWAAGHPWASWCCGQANAEPRCSFTDFASQNWAATRLRVAAIVELYTPESVHLVSGSWETLPHLEATWFVDPPYRTSAGLRYRCEPIDYAELDRSCSAVWGPHVIQCDSRIDDSWEDMGGYVQSAQLWGRGSAGGSKAGEGCRQYVAGERRAVNPQVDLFSHLEVARSAGQE